MFVLFFTFLFVEWNLLESAKHTEFAGFRKRNRMEIPVEFHHIESNDGCDERFVLNPEKECEILNQMCVSMEAKKILESNNTNYLCFTFHDLDSMFLPKPFENWKKYFVEPDTGFELEPTQ